MEKIIGKTSVELEESDVKDLIIYALKVKYGYEVENVSINVGNELCGFGSMGRSEAVFKNAIAILK